VWQARLTWLFFVSYALVGSHNYIIYRVIHFGKIVIQLYVSFTDFVYMELFISV
jgi:hypothetical protein